MQDHNDIALKSGTYPIQELVKAADNYFSFLKFCDEKLSDLEYCKTQWPEFNREHKDFDFEGLDYNHIYHRYRKMHMKSVIEFLRTTDIDTCVLEKQFRGGNMDWKLKWPIEMGDFFVWIQNWCALNVFELVFGKEQAIPKFKIFHDNKRPWFDWWKDLQFEQKTSVIKLYLETFPKQTDLSKVQTSSWISISTDNH